MPVVPSEANFVWLDVPEQAAALGAFSERRGVVLRVFAGVGVRITIGTADENDRVGVGARGGDRRRRAYSGTHSLTSSPMPSIAVRTVWPARR